VEITTYLEHAMSSELQGNVIDLCPVGALTSAPYEFKARPWELRKTETVDAMDAVGSNIRVDVRGREVMRILPRLNEDVNEEWISDKTRFVWDGLRSQRLDKPYVRENGRLREAGWDEAFGLIADKMKSAGSDRTAALIGGLAAVEETFALKALMQANGVKNIDCRAPGSSLGERGGRAGFLFNASIAGIEDADAILIIGANPRLEASVLNTRIRKHWLNTGLPVAVIGENADLTYDYSHLGAGPESLSKLADGKDKFLSVLKKAERPLIIVGQGAISRSDGAAVLSAAAALAIDCGAVGEDWNGFSVLHTAAGTTGALEICALPSDDGGRNTAQILKGAKAGEIDVLYLLHSDEIDMKALGSAFVIYQGSHGDAGAHRADVVLPGAAYTEKSATWVNTEGRPQMARRAGFPPGDAREDWTIIRALSDRLGTTLEFNTIDELRARIYAAVPHLAAIDQITPADPAELADLANAGGKLGSADFVSPVSDFYLTNPIARASAVMAECSALRAGQRQAAE
jgi:NADH-quinone oxidoreductase subunit G